MAKTILRAHSIRTKWHPLPEMAEWPMDHTFVSTAGGESWNCFGRGLSDEPDAPTICQSEGELLWARKIAGADGKAGIDFSINGICHHCANRILIPSGIDVSHAPGNELATPVFGKYGLGTAALVTLVKEAAYEANHEVPGSVSEESVEIAVAQITRGKDSELEILASDIETILNIRTSDIAQPTKQSLVGIYTDLYEHRDFNYKAFREARLTREQYYKSMQESFVKSLQAVRDLIGEEKFKSIFPYPMHLAAEYLFYNPPLDSAIPEGQIG